MFSKFAGKFDYIVLGFALGILLNVADVLVDTQVLGEGTLYQQMFMPTAMEVWTRGLVLLTCLAFGFYVTRSAAKRVKAEKLVQERELNLRFVFENLPDAGILINHENLIVDMNEAAERFTRYSRADLLRRTFGSVFLPILNDQDDSLLGMAATDRDPLVNPVCYSLLRKDGKELTIDIQIFPLQIDGKKFSLGILRDSTQRNRLTEALQEITSGMSGVVGEAFFAQLVKYLAATVDVAYAFVGQVAPGGSSRVYTRAVCADGETVKNFTYDLENAPCANVLTTGMCCYPSGVRSLFPEDQLLFDMEIESYLGVPLYDSNGKAIGLLVLCDREPLIDVAFAKSIIEVFAARAAGELERSQAEQALAESERRFRNLITNQGEGVSVIDREMTFQFVNPAGELIFGVKRGSLVGRKLSEFVSDAQLEIIRTEQSKRQRGVSSTYEFEIRRNDGEVRTLIVTASPQYDDAGEFESSFSVFRDITERKQMEEELRRNEGLIRSTFESSNDGILVVDYNGKVLQTNDRFSEMWRIPSDVLDKKDDDQLLKHVFEQLADPEHFINKVKQLYRTTEESLDTLHFKDGRVFERSSSPLVFNERLAGRVWNFRDITERRKAEGRLRRAQFSIDNMSDAVHWIGLDGKVLDVNANACRMLGYTREELLSFHIWDFETLKSREEIERNLETLKVEVSVQFESEHRRKDGSSLPVEIAVNALEFEGERIACSFIRDITERKHNETVQSVLYSIADATSGSESLEELLETIQVQIGRLIDTKNFYVALYDEATDLYNFAFMRDEFYESVRDIPPQKLKRSLTDYVRRTGKALLLTEQDHLDLIEKGDVELVGEPSKLWMGVPLYNDDKVIGVVGIQSYSDESLYTEQDKELMTIVAGTIAMSIQRKRAEESIRKLRGAVESSGEVIFMTDREGTFTYVNPEFTNLYGYKAQEVVGRETPRILRSNDTLPEVYREFWQALLAGQVIRKEFVNKTREGDQVTVAASINPILDDDGDITGFLAVQRDVTLQRIAERELAQANQMIRIVLDTIPVRVFWKDHNSVYLGCNRLFAEDTGVQSPEQVQGKRDEELVWDGRAVSYVDEDRAIIESGQPQLNTLETLRLANNEEVWIQKSKIPLKNLHGEIIGVLGTYLDITDRIRAEKELQDSEAKLAEAQHIAKMGSWEVDVASNIVNSSEEFIRIFNLEEHEGQILVEDVLKKFHPEDLPGFMEVWQGMLEGAGEYYYDHRVVHDDGTVLHVRCHGMAFFDENNKPTRAIGTSQDVTELKQAEAEKKALEAKLRRTQRLETIGTLAGGIAHDFNNILTPILGYADMAMISVDEHSVAREDLQRVIKAANRAKELVQQILAFSRQGEQEHKPLELHLIIKEAMELLRASLPATIEIRQRISKDCGRVLADPSQIHQVVMNLCTNAFHAMRERGGILTVSLDCDSEYAKQHGRLQTGNWARLSVSDTGCGMDKSIMDRVFEPFFTTKNVGEGTGLGLSMVHGIITQHGGEISVESKLGKGSTFTIHLPMIDKSEAAELAPEEMQENGSGHVLLVDDEVEITSVMKRLLERQGYHITTMNEPKKALALFSSAPKEFDLVVLDQTMPGLTGVELASELLAVRPELPIILVTGYSESVTPEAALKLGIRDYLNKPVSSRELGDAIRKHIGNSQTTEV